MTEREVLKLALEALKQIDEAMPFPVAKLAIMEADKALAQPEQEPVAWMEKDVLPLTHIIKAIVRREKDETYTEPLYTTPPQRTWVGLTDEEFQYCVELKNPESIAEEVEAKLKEKNT